MTQNEPNGVGRQMAQPEVVPVPLPTGLSDSARRLLIDVVLPEPLLHPGPPNTLRQDRLAASAIAAYIVNGSPEPNDVTKERFASRLGPIVRFMQLARHLPREGAALDRYEKMLQAAVPVHQQAQRDTAKSSRPTPKNRPKSLTASFRKGNRTNFH